MTSERCLDFIWKKTRFFFSFLFSLCFLCFGGYQMDPLLCYALPPVTLINLYFYEQSIISFLITIMP